MPGIEKDVPSFLEAVASTQDVWASLDIRTVGINVDGEWHNLMTRCVLDARQVESVPRAKLPADTSYLACREEVRPASMLAEMIARILKDGVESVSGLDIKFVVHDHHTSPPRPYHSSYLHYVSDLQAAPEVLSRVGHFLRISGGTTTDLYQRLPVDREALQTALRILEQPWDGLESVSRYGLRAQVDLNYGSSVVLDFVAPFELRFERLELSGGAFHFRLRAESAKALDRCSIGLFGRTNDGGLITLTVPAQEGLREESTAGATLTGSCPVPGAYFLIVLLRFGGVVALREEITDPSMEGGNPRIAAYQVFDRDLERLTHLLSDPAQAESKQFHQAVARLFTFAGFVVDSFVVDNKLKVVAGVPDFLAHAVSDRLLFIVECTLGPLATKEGKPVRLATRAQDAQGALAPLGQEVLSVMATSREAVIESERQAAAADKIVVLTRPQLLEMLELTKAHAEPRTIVQWLRQQVPVIQSDDY